MNENDKTKAITMKANTLWNSIGSLFYLGCQWATTIAVVSLSSSYENSGIYSIAMNVGLIFTTLGTCNIRTYQVSDVDDSFSANNYVAFRLVTLIAGFALCIPYCGLLYKTQDVLLACFIFLIFKCDEAFCDVLYGIYQKNLRMDYIGKSQLARGALSLMAFCIGLFTSNSLPVAIALMALSCILVTITYDIPHSHLFYKGKPSISLGKAQLLVKQCMPLMIACLLNTSIASITRQIYGLQEGMDSLGIYAAISTPAVIIQAGIAYLYSPWISILSEDSKNSPRIFLKKMNQLLCMLGIIGVVATLLLSPIGIFILPKIYPNIENYAWIFPFVLIATTSIAILGFIHSCFIIQRQLKKLIMLNLIAFAVSVVTVSPCVYATGMNGVNIAIILGSLTGIIYGIFKLRNLVHDIKGNKAKVE